MSQTVIFSIGAIVFAVTVWGAVMASGIWLGQLVESDAERSMQQPLVAKDNSDERTTSP